MTRPPFAPTPAPPVRGPRCPPPVDLEELAAGEPGRPGAAAHLGECSPCRGYVELLRAEREAFLRQRPQEMFLRQVATKTPQPGRRRRWVPALAFGLPALALAVGISVALVGTPPGIRGKGGALTVVVQRPGESGARPVAQDARLDRGDALRFSFAAPRDGYLMILDLDGSGKATVFHPYGGARSSRIRAGAADFLPNSVILDAAPGPEWIVAVFSPEPLEAEPLLAQVRATPWAGAPAVQCPGCQVEALRIQKGR